MILGTLRSSRTGRKVANVYGPSIREALWAAEDLDHLDRVYMMMVRTCGPSPATLRKIRRTYLLRRDVLKVRLVARA